MKKNYKNLMLGLLCTVVIGFTGCQKDVSEVSSQISTKEICDSSSMKNLTNPVSSEEDFTDLIREVAIELLGEVGNYGARTVASTPDAAVKQIDAYVNEFVNSVLKTIEGLGDLGDLEEFDPSTLSDLKINFKFDKEIDIGQLKFSEWIDVVSEVLEDFVKTVIDSVDEVVKDSGFALPDDWDNGIFEDIPTTRDEINKAIIDSISLSDTLIGQAVVDILDKYCVIKAVGLGTKINIDLDFGKLLSLDFDYLKKTILDLGLSGKLSVGIANFDRFYKEVLDSVDVVSVKGVAANTSGKVELTLAGADVNSWMSYFNFGGLTDVTLTKAALNGSNSVVFAICTSEGKGGYITFAVDEVLDADTLIKTIKLVLNEKFDEEQLMNFANNALKISISVSDGTKETWKKNYTVETFMELMETIFPSDEI